MGRQNAKILAPLATLVLSFALEKSIFLPNALNKLLVAPKVYILPITMKRAPLRDDVCEFGQARHFHNWLHTSANIRNTISEGEIFFVPQLMVQCHLNRTDYDVSDVFRSLNRVISTFANSTNFILDRTVMAVPHPFLARTLRNSNEFRKLRNVLDIRFLRVDNDLTPNGRDIFIPYDVHVHKKAEEISLRPLFVFAPCRERAMDPRKWRSTLYSQWKDLPDSLIANNSLTPAAFSQGMASSDFCAVVPGDTSSSSKLYKAIFQNCIPVIFVSYPHQLPFARQLNWTSFSFIFYKDAILQAFEMQRIADLLQSVRKNAPLMLSMKEKLMSARDMFDYHYPGWPTLYHLTMMEVLM